jgi:mannose-6-phosphate isomerase class I
LSAEILLCVGGEGKLTWSDDTLKISSGESVFVPQAISEYICSGDMELFRAVVPIQ